MEEAQNPLQEQLETVEGALDCMTLLITATVLSYSAIDQQRQQVEAMLDGRDFDPPDLFPIQASASMLSLYALSYFYSLTEQASSQPQATPALEEASRSNLLASRLVLLAAGLRLYGLILTALPGAASAAEKQAEAEEAEEGLF